YPDLRPRSDPTLALPNGGPGVFVVFPDTIVLKTLFKGTTFEDEIILRNRQSDRIIGLGLGGDRAYWLRWGAEMDPTSIVIVVASESGILKCEMNIEAVEKTPTQPGDAQIRQTLQLKSKLEQAVFFDSQQQVSTAFEDRLDIPSLAPLLRLNQGVRRQSQQGRAGPEQRDPRVECVFTSFLPYVSMLHAYHRYCIDAGIYSRLRTASKHIPTVGDLKISLRERLNRLKAIVKFIDANRVMNKVVIEAGTRGGIGCA
ncbi:hypothetical protein BC938DRAFT_478658, partial [Jimgerdemannia flammicorona]